MFTAITLLYQQFDTLNVCNFQYYRIFEFDHRFLEFLRVLVILEFPSYHLTSDLSICISNFSTGYF